MTYKLKQKEQNENENSHVYAVSQKDKKKINGQFEKKTDKKSFVCYQTVIIIKLSELL